MNYLGQTEYDSIADIDIDIDKYQKNIAGLNKIIRVGSPAGQKLAAGKLAEAKKNLAVLLEKRERFSETLDGFGELGDCGRGHGHGRCGCGGRGRGGRGWGRGGRGCGSCNRPVSMFPCMRCGRHRPKTNAGCPHCGQNAGWAKCGGMTVRDSGGLGDFNGVTGSLVGNLGVLAIVSASLVAWLIQQNKGGAARDDGLQWYDIAALPTHAVMIPLSYVAKMIGP
jgi:hypothetical protein